MRETQPDETGHWGVYGGRFVPETLMAPLEELTSAYFSAREDSSFQSELASLLRDYAGRPTPLFHAARLTEHAGGARIYLKREDLLHTGAHKINNTLGQVSLAHTSSQQHLTERVVGSTYGQATRYCRNGSRPARRCDGDGLRALWFGLRCLHGRRGHATPGPECVPDEFARR